MKAVIDCACAICWAIVLFMEVAILSRSKDEQIPNSIALIATVVCLLNAIASVVSNYV